MIHGASNTAKKSNHIIIRKIHFWVSLFVIIPLFIVTTTGLMLMLKKQFTWIQPATQKGISKTPTLRFEDVLQKLKENKEVSIESWEDIERIDVRPSKGVMKVKTNNSYEVQLDASTGEVLQVAYRRSDMIETIHDGSFMGKPVKYIVFFTAEILFFIQLITGIYLFVRPLLIKRKKRKQKA